MSFGAETPFILLARIQVKPDKVQEYLLLAAKTDKAVEDSEPGMIHHTLIKILKILFVLFGPKFIKMTRLSLLI